MSYLGMDKDDFIHIAMTRLGFDALEMASGPGT